MTIGRSRIEFIAGVSFLVMMSACSSIKQGGASVHGGEGFLMLNQSFVLSEAELQTLPGEALRGSPEAAYRLFLFYQSIKGDSVEGLFWLHISAENGYPTGQYALAMKLSEDDDPRNRQRSRFWLDRAAKNGNKPAQETLREPKE